MSSEEDDTELNSTREPRVEVEKKLTPSKLRRKEERAEKFNSNASNAQELEEASTDEMANAKITCGYFEYHGDANTLGSRWTTWEERFDLQLTANGITDSGRIKASFLILIGLEAYAIYQTKKKTDNSDTMDEVRAFMRNHFVGCYGDPNGLQPMFWDITLRLSLTTELSSLYSATPSQSHHRE